MIDLIPLQTAYIRQSRDVRDNAWVIYDTDGNELGELSNTYSPEQAMSYLHFARKFELEALNTGINFGRREAQSFSQMQIEVLKNHVSMLEQENIGLATHLEKHLEGAL